MLLGPKIGPLNSNRRLARMGLLVCLKPGVFPRRPGFSYLYPQAKCEQLYGFAHCPYSYSYTVLRNNRKRHISLPVDN
jgi:hypothetical protein